VPPPVRDAAFAAAAPQGVPVIETVPLADGSQIVFRLTRVEPGDADSVPVAERRQLRDQLIRRSGGEEITAYLTQLRDDASVVVSTEQFE
jgi:hypothetical protein